ncbi:Uncharacterised protein [Burkholderia pseudomallei]|nr:Uncharacterised protein [Burkholderia pseudomallei]CAJ3480300.1 Uncharacterised protein [Burkholderia pseudomallei]CAJ3592653.1 Uncharacterised protein [Burkholderia pseudomallei]CAJ3642426.1 Uncharacterised protein [Burkholderia pseudomallei]CAJ3713331.1 Uncharacterised protein [Burkholderia pseudomallei]
MADKLIGTAFSRAKSTQARRYAATSKDVARLMICRSEAAYQVMLIRGLRGSYPAKIASLRNAYMLGFKLGCPATTY